MRIDWNAMAAVAGLAAALVAVAALVFELRTSRTSIRIGLIMELEREYRSPEFAETRARAAQCLLDAPERIGKDASPDQVLAFFEFLGLLRRVNALSDFLIWHSFSTHIFYYMAAARSYILAVNASNRSLYCDFLTLHKAMRRIERWEAGAESPELNLKDEDVREFLRTQATAAHVSEELAVLQQTGSVSKSPGSAGLVQ